MSAIILQFPRRQTAGEVIREWVILSAQYLPHIYPGGLSRNLERDVARWMQLVNLREEFGTCFINRCRAEIAKYKESLANGWTSIGRIGDPKAEAHWYASCVASYGEPDEGHEAWLPWLEQQAADTGHARDGGARLLNLRKESRSDLHPIQ